MEKLSLQINTISIVAIGILLILNACDNKSLKVELKDKYIEIPNLKDTIDIKDGYLNYDIDLVCAIILDSVDMRDTGTIPFFFKDYKIDERYFLADTKNHKDVSLREEVFNRLKDTFLLKQIINSSDSVFDIVHNSKIKEFNPPKQNISNLEFAKTRFTEIRMAEEFQNEDKKIKDSKD